MGGATGRAGAAGRAAAAIVALAMALGAAGCSDDADDATRDITPGSSVPGASVTGPDGSAVTTTIAGAAFQARVAAVDPGDLKLGAKFNTQFLTLQFLAVGLDATESACAAERVTAAAGTEFANRPVSQVMSGAGITPDVLLPCVPTERMMTLAESAGGADLGRVPPDVLRSTLTELASAGYEVAGMTPVEATCLADRVVGTYTDDDLVGVMTDLSLPADRAVTALPACVTGERANELGA